MPQVANAEESRLPGRLSFCVDRSARSSPSKTHLNGIKKTGGRIDELQRGLGLAEGQRKTRAPVRQLNQPFPFLDKNRVGFFDRELHDTLDRAVLAKIRNLLFNRDEV